MAKWCCGNELASVKNAIRCSSFARTVIAAIATAVPGAANRPAANSGNAPTSATNRVPKAGSIIVIASGNIAAAAVKHNRE